jgi:hypothetical protein
MKKNKELIQFFLWGLLICFFLKNAISIINGSFGGDAEYIVSNPSIDAELWYVFGILYILTVKVFFKPFFKKVSAQLRGYDKVSMILDKYAQFRRTKLFKALVFITFLLLALMVMLCTVACFGSDKIIFKLSVLLFVYLAFVFNLNYKIVNLKYLFK